MVFPIHFSEIPERIRLSDGRTRTVKDTFSEEELVDAGWVKVNNPPEYDNKRTTLLWENDWVIMPIDRTEKILEAKQIREQLLSEIDWRTERHNREYRLNLEPTELLEDILKFEKDILEVEKQPGYPYEIKWPPINKLINLTTDTLMRMLKENNSG